MIASEYESTCELNKSIGIHRPNFFLQLHITPYCNLRCIHCYQEFNSTDLKGILTPMEIISIIRQYSRFLTIQHFPGTIYLTGGEPTLETPLFTYVAVAKQLGIFPMILTNGTLIDILYAKKLARAGAKLVQISIDGLEDTHDIIRGKGMFQKATQGLDACHAVGLKTLVMFTFHRLNIRDMEGLIIHCINHDVSRLAFHRLVPVGRGAQLYDEILTPLELKQFYTQILKWRKKFHDQIEITSHDPLWQQFIGIKNTFGCCIGFSGLCILHNGDILPCRRLNKVIGNIRDTRLLTIWNNTYFIQFQKRIDYHGQCQSCKRLPNCTGCRAVAYATTGSEFGSDPQCFFHI